MPSRFARPAAVFTVLLVAGLATMAVQWVHSYSSDRRDAARHVLEVESSVNDYTLAIDELSTGSINAAQFKRIQHDTRAAAEHSLAAIITVDAVAAADLRQRWAGFDKAVAGAAVAQMGGDVSTATWDIAGLDQLRARFATEVDAIQARFIDLADRSSTGADVTSALLIVGSILAVTAVTARAAQRRQRLALVESQASALQRSEATFRLLFENNPQPMYAFATDSLRVLAVNPAAMDFYGYTRDELLAMTVFDLLTPDLREQALSNMDVAREETLTGFQVRQVTKHGKIVDVEVHSRHIAYEGVTAKLVLVVDMTQRNSLENELRHQAFHDSLTGLANRALFLDRVEHAMAKRTQGGGLLLLDLDGFKTVNDSLGHVAGDLLLVAVGERLAAAVRPGDTVARLGGDEFAILLEGTNNLDDVRLTSQRVLDSLRAPFHAAERSISINASIGVALTGGDDRQASTVLREADLAMYVAKGQGKGRFQIFNPTMQADAMERLALEQDLRRALDAGQLRLVYQPKVDAASGRATAAEALLRWDHPVRGAVPPAQFIPIAEEVGLIIALDSWVLDTACTQAAAWIAAGLPLDHIAVNVSGRELENGDLLARVSDVLARTGLPGERLEIELTEGAAVHQPDAALAEMKSIRELGVTIALDDFGTGYSMLSRLQDFPVDRLKVDRSFIADIGADGSAPLVAAMIAMGHELGLEVVAEGVETADQLRFLRSNSCDQLQGYLLSRPISAEAFEQVLGTVVDGAGDGDAVAEPSMQGAA